MKLLLVLSSLRRGGAETSVAQLAKVLPDHGIVPTVVALAGPTDLAPSLLNEGIDVLVGTGARSRASQLGWLVRQIEQIKPDHVHTSVFEADVLGRLAARRAGTSVTSSIINTMYGPEQSAGVPRHKVLAAQMVDATTARLTTRLHAVSAHAADVMSSRLRYPRHRISVVPRSRDATALGTRSTDRRRCARAALDVQHDQPLVVCVGRQEHQKGFDVALDVAARLPPQVLVRFAGATGRATPQLSQRAAARGLNWTELALGERDDIGDLMAAADVLLFPSRWEGLPGTLIEALLLRLPVSANDIPQVREVAAGAPSVRLAANNTADEHAANILALLGSPTDTDSGRRHALRAFDPSAVSTAMARFFTEAATSSA